MDNLGYRYYKNNSRNNKVQLFAEFCPTTAIISAVINENWIRTNRNHNHYPQVVDIPLVHLRRSIGKSGTSSGIMSKSLRNIYNNEIIANPNGEKNNTFLQSQASVQRMRHCRHPPNPDTIKELAGILNEHYMAYASTLQRPPSRFFQQLFEAEGETVGIVFLNFDAIEKSNEYFEKILNTVNLNAEIYELEPLDDTKRIKKTPKRLQYTSNPPTKLSPICELKKDMFEIIDYLINEIDRRFNQQGLKNLVKLEHILVDQNTRIHQELTNCLNNMSEDFDINKLHAQLIMLPSIVSITSISDIINHLRNEYSNVKDSLFSEITKLIKLILTIPASAATAECSFSALRRLKTYLRSTMTQKRLTHMMILHVHKSMTAKIDLKLIAKEFVSRTSERKSTFGNFY
ncbi:hypothetical protein QTP88_022835 [Uroleucon formosanum]